MPIPQDKEPGREWDMLVPPGKGLNHQDGKPPPEASKKKREQELPPISWGDSLEGDERRRVGVHSCTLGQGKNS